MTRPVAVPERADPVGLGICLGAAVLLGLAIAVSRYAYDGGTNGLTIAGLRCAVAAVLLAGLCVATRRRLALPAPILLHCYGNGVLFSIMSYGNVGSVQFIPVGLAALLFFTYPPIVAASGALLLRDPVSPAKALAIGGAFVGLALMLGVSVGSTDPRGIALARAAAFGAAINAHWLVRRLRHVDGVVMTFHITVGAAVVLAAATLGSGSLAWPDAVHGWWGLAGVVGFQSIGLPLYFLGIQRIGAVRGTMITNVQPVVSIVAAWLLFGELLTPVQLLGGAMVLGGFWTMQWDDARRRRAAAG